MTSSASFLSFETEGSVIKLSNPAVLSKSDKEHVALVSLNIDWLMFTYLYFHEFLYESTAILDVQTEDQ